MRCLTEARCRMSADGNEVFTEVRSRMGADGHEVFSGSEVKDEC